MNLTSENINLKKKIAIPLLIWGIINVIAGIFYLFPSTELIQGFLIQAFFWGLIDGIIGLLAYLSKKELNLEKIKKIFLINVYLDVLYIIIGVLLILFANSGILIGTGYGLVIQGAFLLIVDLYHYMHIKKKLILSIA